MRYAFLVLAAALLSPTALAQNTGKMAGCVTDSTTGEPLVGANVFILEIERGAATDIDGCYTILGIPVGTYTVRFAFAGMETQDITEVEIPSGRTRALDSELSSPWEDPCGWVCCFEEPLFTTDIYTVRQVINDGGRKSGMCCPLSGNDVLLSNLPVER